MEKQKYNTLTIETIEKYVGGWGVVCMKVNGKYRTIYNGEKIGETKKYIIHKDNNIVFVNDNDKTYM